MIQNITFNVNGDDYTLGVRRNETLQDLLRLRLGLTGTKKGCEVGVCGSCTVIMNEEPVNRESPKAEEGEKSPSPASPSPDETPETGGPSGAEWENELDVYPLRGPGDDPRWAVRTVWIWTGVAIASILFILTLLVLGAIYD